MNNRLWTSRLINPGVTSRQTSPGCTFSADQRLEIECVVRYQHVAIIDGPAHDRPVFARAQPQPRNMSGFSISAFAREPDELGTQAFVNQELHARTTASAAIVLDVIGGRDRHTVFVRGRPLRG
jgi:hypothetical protein